MKRKIPFDQITPPLLLGIVLFWIYVITMAPGLTWANNGSDGGDLVTAAAIGGVPHPTGYPLYLLIAKIFQIIPVGSLAYRTNLLSAVCMTLASLVLYVLVTQYLASQERSFSRFAGMVAGFTFGLAPLVWSQAIITEVYALHALLISVLLLLWGKSGDANPLTYRWRGLCLGFALGNHLTSIFLLPIFIADIFLDKKISTPQKWTLFLNQSLWTFAGLTVYLVLPLRALSVPPVNWGNAETVDGLIWLVSGRLYWGELSIPAQSLFYRVAAWATLLLENFSLAGIYLGLMGVVYFFRKSRFYVSTFWVAIIFSIFSIEYRTVDSNMYLIPVFFSFAAWVGVGVDGMLNLVPQKPLIKISVGAIVILFILINAIYTFPKMDLSNDRQVDQFAADAFAQAPANAVLFAKGDRAVFSLWYYHYALRERPDLSVIASDLLHFPWYLETLQATYPTLNLSEPFPWPQTIIEMNPDLPYCYISVANTTRIDCAYQ